MQTQSWSKRLLPYLLAIIAFLAISAIFSAPSLKGDLIAPHDTVSWMYMSKEAHDYYQANGTSAGWTNNMFSGMPTVTFYEPGTTNWPGTISGWLQMQPSNMLVNPIGLLFISMLGAFALLKSFRVSTLIAAFGGISYALSSYIPILIGAGHITKAIDLAYLPGVIGGLIFAFRGNRALGTIIYMVFLAFFMSAWHLQIIYYSLFLIIPIGLYFLVQAVKHKTMPAFSKTAALIILASIIAVMPVYNALQGTNSYVKHSMRGGKTELTHKKGDKTQENNGGLTKDYAFSWSNGIGETFCAVIPNYYGGGSGSDLGENSKFGEALANLGAPSNQVEQYTANAPTYFGTQPFLSGPMYFGAIVCFLSILALFTIKSKFKWILLGTGVFFAMLSWGKNFESLNYWLFDNFPLFNKFRSPNMALSLTTVTTLALAFWGLYDIQNQLKTTDKAVLFKKFKQGAYTGIGLVVLLIIYSQMMMSFKSNSDAQLSQSFGQHASQLLSALRADRSSMVLKDGLRSLVFILIAAAAIWALMKEKISAQTAVIVIGVASIVDLWGVGKRYLNEDKFMDEYSIEQQFFTPSAPVAQIMQDKDPNFKVLDLNSNTFNDAKTSYFLKTVGGYHPAKLQSYQDLIETQISRLNRSVLNMLNTKYIITPAQQGQQASVMPNSDALGNAWFVSSIKFTPTADATIEAMNGPLLSDAQIDTNNPGFKPAEEAIVRQDYQAKIGNAQFNKTGASIQLTKYDLPYLAYESNNPQDGFAVFSEVYYPENWTAYIDGKQAEIIPVNYLLRGLKVPAGKHKIEFKYLDENKKMADTVQLIGSILFLLALGGLAFMGIKQCKQGKCNTSEII